MDEQVTTFEEWFPIALREARLAMGLVQETLAPKIGVSIGTVKNWEQGRTLPGSEEFMRVCALFGWPHPDVNLPGLDKGRLLYPPKLTAVS